MDPVEAGRDGPANDGGRAKSARFLRLWGANGSYWRFERQYLTFAFFVFIVCGFVLLAIGAGSAFAQRNDRVTIGYVMENTCRPGNRTDHCNVKVDYRAGVAYESSELRNVPVANIHTLSNGAQTTGVRYSTDSPSHAKQPNDFLPTPGAIGLVAGGAVLIVWSLFMLRRGRVDHLVQGQRDVVRDRLGFAHADWRRDPSGRHELRYFDGAAWTAYVADAGVQALDPYE